MQSSPSARIANIGSGERRARLQFGIMALVFGIAIAVLLAITGAPLVWRLPLFLPFYFGALGFFQSRDKT